MINIENEPFSRDAVFDEVTNKNLKQISTNNSKTLYFFKKTVLIGLLCKCFTRNLSKFPAHVIYVGKQDVSNIESITFSHDCIAFNLISPSEIDLSKLVRLCKL